MQKPDYTFERLVTKAEATKAHITIIVIHHDRFKKTFGPIYREDQVEENDALALKPFFIEKENVRVNLKLVYRSPDKNGKPRNELRLYFNKGKGQFKPAANEIIIANFYGDEVVLSVRPSDIKDATILNAKVRKAEPPVYDSNDPSTTAYTTLPSTMTVSAREAWRRDAKSVRKCLKNAAYACEAGFVEPSFIARKTKKPYLEVHHLVPLRYQGDFTSFNLNDPANLFALSPHAHRAIHHGQHKVIRTVVETLLGRRPQLLAKLPKDTILEMYKCV